MTLRTGPRAVASRAAPRGYVLGINSHIHDSSACLLADGVPVMAVEEERLSREKHSKAFPKLAIARCLAEAGIELADVGDVALCFDPWRRLPRLATHLVRNLPSSVTLLRERARGGYADMFRMKGILRRELDPGRRARRLRFHFVEHHLAHAASVYHASPFASAAILSVDGVGEWSTTLLARGDGARMEKLGELEFPDSLGLLYQAVTVHLGFRRDYDETKVMGLASYGDPDRFRALFEEVLRLGAGGEVAVSREHVSFGRVGHRQMLTDRFAAAAGPQRRSDEPLEQRHRDLAAALQNRLDEAGVHLARELQARSGCRALCLAGGVALNSVMNERIRRDAGFDELFVQPACNDAGTAMGAALWLWHARAPRPRAYVMTSPYLGPGYDDGALASALRAAGIAYDEPGDLATTVARLLASGAIVGWFQGRLEWGPRALGNRSILADPRRAGVRDDLNVKVKHRETFRPFAPVVLDDRAAEFFDPGGPSPFMLFVRRVLPEKRALIPAVTHVDGTARVQTVTRDANPRLASLLEAFGALTGVPVLLNTSFNDRDEPIVCSPEDAIRTYVNTRIDALVLGPYLARKPAPAWDIMPP